MMLNLNTLIKKIQTFYIDHIDPDGIQPIHALRTTMGTIFAMIVYRAFDWPQAYWMVFSTIMILQTYNSPTPKLRWRFMLVSGTAITLLTFISSILCQSVYIFALFLTLTTFIAVYIRVLSDDVASAAFYVNLFCLSAGAFPVSLIEIYQRTASVLIGFIIAIGVCLFMWPDNLKKSIRKILAENLTRLAEFNQALFERSWHQKVISVRRNRLMRGFELARHTIPKEEFQSLQIVMQIEYLYEIILILNELNHLIQKQKILRIVNKELNILFRRLTRVLRGFSKSVRQHRSVPSMVKFVHSLDSFEKYYSRHLKKFNDEQLLAFTVYIYNIDKLKMRINTLRTLIQQKGVRYG
jgi:uncharacterized membrane protein YccC